MSRLMRIHAVDVPRFKARLEYLMHERCTNTYLLSKELGISHSATRRWVDGTGLPDAHGLALLCQYFGCSSDWLLGLLPDIPDPIYPRRISSCQ